MPKKILKFVVQLPLFLLSFFKITEKNTPRALRHRELLDFMTKNNLEKNAVVLDIGCGTGEFLRNMHSLGYRHLHGCDWLEGTSIEFKYSQVDLNRDFLKSYPDNFFDTLICSDVIEHMENPAELLREMSRVLKPSGSAFVTIPNAWNLIERFYFLFAANSTRYTSERRSPAFGHISFFTSDIIESLIDRAGLALVQDQAGSGFMAGYALKFPKTNLLGYNYMFMLKPIQKPH